MSPGVQFQIRRLVALSEARAEEGDIEGARGAIHDALRLEPDNVDLLCALGRVELCRGDVDAASARYEHSLALDGAHLIARFELACLRTEQGRYGEAEALLCRLRGDVPDSPELLAELASLYRVTGRLQRAVRVYEEALELEPDSLELVLSRAIALCEAGEFGRAGESLHASSQLRGSPQLLALAERLRERLLDRGDDAVERLEILRSHGAVLLGHRLGVHRHGGLLSRSRRDLEGVSNLLRRFLTLQGSLGWTFSEVMPIDSYGVDLAHVLRCRGPQPERGSGRLWVSASMDAGALESLRAQVDDDDVIFVMSFVDGGDPVGSVPDVIGDLIEGTEDLMEPWGGVRSEPWRLLMAAVDGAPDDPEMRLQLRGYWRQSRHLRSRLRPPRDQVIDIRSLLPSYASPNEVLSALASGDGQRVGAAVRSMSRAETQDPRLLDASVHTFADQTGVRPQLDELLRQHAPTQRMEMLKTILVTGGYEERKQALDLLLRAPTRTQVGLEELFDGAEAGVIERLASPEGWPLLIELEGLPGFEQLVERCLSEVASSHILCWLSMRRDWRFDAAVARVLPDLSAANACDALTYLAGCDYGVDEATLVALFGSTDPVLREAVCGYLQRVDVRFPIWRLCRAIRRDEATVAAAAVVAVNQRSRHRARRALRGRLAASGPDRAAWVTLCAGVEQSRDPGLAQLLLPFVEAALDPDQITGLLRALAAAGDFAVLSGVRMLLARADAPPVEVFGFLETYGDTDDEPFLVRCLAAAPEIQYRAAATLCRLGRMDFFDILEDGVFCRSEDRFLAAWTSLARVEGPAATGMLLHHCERPPAALGVLVALEIWAERRTLRPRLLAVSAEEHRRVGEFLLRVFETHELWAERVLEVVAAMGTDMGAPTLDVFFGSVEDPERLLLLVDHARRHPSDAHRQAARGVQFHPHMRLARMGRSLAMGAD